MVHSILTVQFMCLTDFCTTSLQVLFGLPLGLEQSVSYSIHFITHSLSSFHNTCPYHCNLFCCSTQIISSILSLPRSLNFLLETLNLNVTHPSDHYHLCPLKYHLIFSLRGQVSFPLTYCVNISKINKHT